MGRPANEIITENFEDGTIQEKWWDRTKIKGQQAIGNVKGAVQQGKGAVQQATGKFINKAANTVGNAIGVDASQGGLAQKGQNMQQQGQQNIQQGQQQGQQRLVQAATQISQARTRQLLGDIANDLQKVGINAQIPQSEIARIQTVISNAINKALQQ